MDAGQQPGEAHADRQRAINGTDNALGNTIIGNGGNNKISGAAGNDTLSGGAGVDIFRFSSALNASTNVDTITDFNPVSDAIERENSVFTKLTATGVLSASFVRSNTTGTAVDTIDYLLYESTPASCATTPTAAGPASWC